MVNEVFALEYNLNENDSDLRYVKLNAQHDRFAEAQLLDGNVIKDQGRNKILPEILGDIFPFLKRDILGKCQLVNLLWNQVIKDPRNNLPSIEIKMLSINILQETTVQINIEYMNHKTQTILYEADDGTIHLANYDFLKYSYIHQLYLSVSGYFGEAEFSLLSAKINHLSNKIGHRLSVKSFECYYVNCNVNKRIDFLKLILENLRVTNRLYLSTRNPESSVEIIYFINEMSKYGFNVHYNNLNGFNIPRDFVQSFYDYFKAKSGELKIRIEVVIVSDDQNTIAEDFLKSIGHVKIVRLQRGALGNHIDYIYSTEENNKIFECRIAKHIYNSVIYATIK